MAGIGHGNYIIPSQCAVVGKSITTYELFPVDTFTAGATTDAITYSASNPPWTPAGRQLLTAAGNVKFNASSRQIYGLPSASLITTPDAFGGQDYPITIIAKNVSDNNVQDTLQFTFRIGASGSAYPLYAVSSSQKKITLSVSSDFSVGSAAHTLGTATADQYAIVWADDNQVGDSEGTNRSPFSISNTGVITVTGTLAIKTYKLWVRATYSTNGNFDVAWVEITNAYTTSSIAGYIGGIPIM